MATVFANGRSITHKGDGQTNIAAPQDVCKTPSPGGPVPIPYVNIAKTSDLAKGSKKVKIEDNPAALKSSNLSTSTGDEPGTAGGGIISSKTKGKLTWGSSSPDVKIEGKNVVRFMDVAQHNGNSFNTAFIEMGGTGFAYGDDMPCRVCKKAQDAHAVVETSEVAAMSASVLLKLNELLEPQRPVIAAHQGLKAERQLLQQRYQRKLDALDSQRNPLLDRRRMLLRAEKKDGKALAEVAAELAPLNAEQEAIKAERLAKGNEFLAKMKAEKSKLDGINVLADDDNTGIYTKGYMVGALVCRCPKNPKKLAACSGPPTPGFKDAVRDAKFTRVDAFDMSEGQAGRLKAIGRKTWDCAAPKLLQAGGADGHKVRSLSEKWYSPVAPSTVKVTYRRDGKIVTEVFRSGMTVPSCDVCQELAPEMLCDNEGKCS